MQAGNCLGEGRMNNIAVVTGASSGVGREFVRQLDRGAGGPLDQIWIVARNADALAVIAEQTATPVRAFALDLTEQSSYECLRDALEDEAPTVQWLVNSAGFGKFGDFGQIAERD